MTPNRSAADPDEDRSAADPDEERGDCEREQAGGPVRISPEEAFAILGNETRLAILRALEETRDRPVGFAELRKRVGVADGSRFNYHLRKLQPGFVRETDEGYHVRKAGIRVLRAIVAGTFTEHPRFGPVDLDAACVDCGGPLAGWYEHGLVHVDCSDCGQLHVIGEIPPAGVANRTERAALHAFERRLRHVYALTLDDVCRYCTSRFERTLLRETDRLPPGIGIVEFADAIDYVHGPGAFYECETCSFWCFMTAGEHLLFEPVVVEFYRDHGIDLDGVPLWKLDWTIPVVAAERTPVVSEEPFRVEMRVRLDDERLRVVLDESFAVVEADRSPAG